MFLAFGAGLAYRWAGYFAYNVIKADGALFWLLYAIPVAGIGLSVFMYMTGRSVAVPDRVATSVDRFIRAWSRPTAPQG